jgi:hypothetical protein
MTGPLVPRLFVMAMLVTLGACKQANDGYEYDEALAGSRFTGAWVYDTGTLCTVGDATMHCCPGGMVMIGAHVGDNVFKCAQLTNTHGNRFLDIDMYRSGVHACPQGGVMVGLHVNNNQVACQTPGPGQAATHVAGTTQTVDGYPMHICPRGHAMSGIRLKDNLLTCDS